MARHGVTYEQAQQVFIALLTQGLPLSVKRARDQFGSGSNSTWQQHIAQFRQAQEAKQLISLPATFPASLLPIVESLWANAVTQASEQFVNEKAKIRQDFTTLEQQQKDLRKQLANSQLLLEERDKDIETLIRNAEKQATQITGLNNTLDEQKAALQQSSETISQLQNAAIEQRENMLADLKQYEMRLSTESQRNADAEALWIQRYDNVNEELKLKNRELAGMGKRVVELSAVKAANDRLKKKLVTHRELMEQQEATYELKLSALNNQLSKADSHIRTLKKDHSNEQESAKSLSKKLNDAESQIKVNLKIINTLRNVIDKLDLDPAIRQNSQKMISRKGEKST